MSTKEDYALMAHLMRRAGFGVSWDDLEKRVAQGYEETVEELLNPEIMPSADEDLLFRYHPLTELPATNPFHGPANWLYHMINSQRPLQEKMALFWHQVFATGNSKVDNYNDLLAQIQMFRDCGMGNYRELLIQLARNPAMIFWLDNNENHKRAPNENWGRELLELFSLGVGNYSEKDVFECARAFTGWTIAGKMPRQPYGRFPWQFEFRAEDHDYTEKTFLGHTGDFNGEDIIDIIIQQPSCPRFIARHLYNFFVADEPQVSAWSFEEPRDPAAIKLIADTFVDSGFEMKPVLRTVLNSDFFKSEAVRFTKIKSPVEVVVGTLNIVKEFKGPTPYLEVHLARQAGYIGQEILDPPSVEGWQTGKEWITSGALVARINFVADMVGNTEMTGVREIVENMASNGKAMTEEAFVDRCLELMGMVQIEERTRREAIDHARESGPVFWDTEVARATSSRRTGEMLALIASSREYQLC